MDLLQHPRYKDRPMCLFFEKYVLDTIGELPDDKAALIQGLGLEEIFGVQADTWQDVMRRALKLSPTLDIAIIDRWLTELGGDLPAEPQAFAEAFADDYFAEDSDVDVWGEGELEAAIERIKAWQAESVS